MDPGANDFGHDHAQAAHGGQAAVQAALHACHHTGQQFCKHRTGPLSISGYPGLGGARATRSPSRLSRSSGSLRCARQMRTALLTWRCCGRGVWRMALLLPHVSNSSFSTWQVAWPRTGWGSGPGCSRQAHSHSEGARPQPSQPHPACPQGGPRTALLPGPRGDREPRGSYLQQEWAPLAVHGQIAQQALQHGRLQQKYMPVHQAEAAAWPAQDSQGQEPCQDQDRTEGSRRKAAQGRPLPPGMRDPPRPQKLPPGLK